MLNLIKKVPLAVAFIMITTASNVSAHNVCSYPCPCVSQIEEVEEIDEDSAEASEFAQEVLELVNIEREKAGVRPLKLSDDLTELANIRAEEIVEVFSHTRPDGRSCFSILSGINYRTCAENIAAGSATPEKVVEQWMNSAGHRANILNGAYRYLGVGYTYDEDAMYEHYWVQLFIG